MKRLCTVWACVFCCVVMAACASDPQSGQTPPPMPGKATVVWISVDGLRGDYPVRAHAAFLQHLAHEGAYSTHLRTIFPTITFASHTSEATGVTVTQHGIPLNDFYDTVTKTKCIYPDDEKMLLAEPIWKTATREGVRTAVYDWPLSQMEHEPNAAAYFTPGKFDAKLTDEARLERVVEAYEKDTDATPLRLLMGYFEVMDKVGHKLGPNAPQIDESMRAADEVLEKMFERVRVTFERRRTSPSDVLVFLVTTDHGMSEVKTLVRLDFVLDLPQHGDVVTVTSGPIGNVYLPSGLSAVEREQRLADYLAKLRAKKYLTAYRQEDLPAQWEFRSATRIGDIVVVLNKGYTFSTRIPLAEYPVDSGGGPKGMHGYPVETNPEMEGYMVAWRSAAPWGGKNLGPVQAIRLHATVARWLGIQPSAKAVKETIGI